jgi:4-hydroxybenzoate polyprenyltransferase
MTNTNSVTDPIPATKPSALRYLSCLRPQDIVVLQGSPLLGAAFAIGRPAVGDLAPLAILVVANILLVSHIFMLNDWSGLASDLADPNKAASVFTTRGVGRREMAMLTAALLILSLIFFTFLGPVTLVLALAIAALSALYSLPRFNWKGKPLLNSIAHLGGGVLHFLLGYSIASTIDQRGVAIATFFAMIFVAGHLTQEVRDHAGDAFSGIRTNAVTLGQRRTFAASVILFAVAHALLFAMAMNGILPRPLGAVVLLFAVQLYWSMKTFREGLTFASVSRLQSRYRALYALIGLAMVAAIFASAVRV